MKLKPLLLIIFIVQVMCGFAQNKDIIPKWLDAKKTEKPIKLDGDISDEAWKTAPVAKDFIEWRPHAGAVEEYASRTEMYILYDDEAVYVAGHCYEQTSDSVSKELVGRDAIGSNDFAAVFFDTYNSKINATGFFVTPLSEQFDAKYGSEGNEDPSWNAVWYSEVKIVNDGWTFEMKIPYAALRFNIKNTTWGLNFMRTRRKSGKQSFWNPVLPTVSGLVSQEGLWKGFTGIQPPVRLSLSPYFSTYLNHYPYNISGVKNYTTSFNGGLDLKYGINESYTLDMTLIPDFGQVQSDKKVLNLTPFEVQYQENRPFFTEGSELFSKGELFYSRRVGGEPINKYHINDLSTNEVVVNNPSETGLYNATKISGRNKKGLGMGLFNAITKPMYATIEDTISHNKRMFETGPLTNYNIIVLDQTLKNNSSVSFINTNVLRNGNAPDADVAAGLFDIYNKKKSYNYFGNLSASFVNGISGYAHNLGFGKVSGRLNFNFVQRLADKNYNINDMGIMQNPDYLEHGLWVGYKWIKPGKWYNNISLNINHNINQRLSDLHFERYFSNINGHISFKNLWMAGMSVNYASRGYDFYEPHKEGYVYKIPQKISFYPWVSTDNAKKYYAELNLGFAFSDIYNGHSYNFSVPQHFRFNDRFSTSFTYDYFFHNNSVGFASFDNSGNVIFSKRNITTIDNSLEVKYSFSKKSSLNLVARHYWSRVAPKLLFTLLPGGDMAVNNTFKEDVSQNANYFNADMIYALEFAPGSFLSIVWKNFIPTYNQNTGYNYFQNFDNTIHAPQNNNLSLKVIYYLDYIKLRKNIFPQQKKS